MKYLDHIEIAIRTAFARCVDQCGGGANMAAALETHVQKISKLQNIQNTPVAAAERTYLRVSDLVRADMLAGEPLMLRELARLEGCTITPAVEQGAPIGDMHTHLSRIAKEFSEAVNELHEGGTPSISKARRIRKEIQDVVDRANDCIAECDHIIAGEKPRIVEGGK